MVITCRTIIFTITLIIYLWKSATSTSATNESQTDRLSLLSFKSLVTDDPDRSLESWNDTLHLCSWAGISCSHRHHGRVTGLFLESAKLAGTISPCIGNLSFLRTIHLQDNNFHGTLPPQFGNLHRLEFLNLSSNLFSGAISPSFVHCRNLKILDVSTNNLAGQIPEELGLLSQLQQLSLMSNSIIGHIPTSIANLTSINWLDLSFNQLSGYIPQSLGNLTCIAVLDLSKNQLKGNILPSLGNLLNLSYLDLSANKLDGTITPSLVNLSSLYMLDLSANSFVGVIPQEVGNLKALISLDMSNNSLTGEIPQSVGSLVSLSILFLSNNKLNGVIPHSIENLTSLAILELSSNNLEGCIPEGIGQLERLESIQLNFNKLSCTIPETLFNNSSLQDFNAVYNRLSGPLLPGLGHTLGNLRILNLFKNQLVGNVPRVLSNATKLQRIDLGKNLFSGYIAVNFGRLKSLYWLSLESNKLEATESTDWIFFDSLANCSKLQVLALSDNNLGGELPTSLSNFSMHLEVIIMGRNRISGSIPQGIENLEGLTRLAIEQNRLSGSIPSSIGKIQSLEDLVLFKNNLSGHIPETLGNLTRLINLYIDGNHLDGVIPVSLGKCQNLNSLDLHNNSFSGPIPEELLSLSTLSNFVDFSYNNLQGTLPTKIGVNIGELDISSNRLSGTIPSAIGDCLTLEYLYMDSNFFHGTIPTSLTNLRGLVQLGLSFNNLTGQIPLFLSDSEYSFLFLDLSYNQFEGEVPRTGIFKNISAFSVMGNSKLCGGVPSLRLPPCPNVLFHSRKGFVHGKGFVLALCSIVSLILVATYFASRYYIRKPTGVSPQSQLLEDQFRKISYAELSEATRGFSSNNLIGVGKFSSVYRGVVDNGETVFAVKVLNLGSRGASKSFMAECEALRNVRHRNLVKIITMCSSVDFRGNDFKALVYEFMNNGSLEQWLYPQDDPTRSLSFVQRLNIAIDVASALDYLHNRCATPIIHCDLKPSNVLLDNDMTARLCDFGLAEFLPTTNSIQLNSASSTYSIKGTIGYVPPEYGVGAQVSTEGDVYSYGILLLELLVARKPTDDMFKDGMTLPRFIGEVISNDTELIRVLDPLLQDELERDLVQFSVSQNDAAKMESLKQCFASLVTVGLLCTRESPRDRLQIDQILGKLTTIKSTYLSL